MKTNSGFFLISCFFVLHIEKNRKRKTKYFWLLASETPLSVFCLFTPTSSSPTIPSSILETTTRFVIYVKFNIRYSYEIKRGSSNPTSQNKKTQAIEMEIACALTDWSIKVSKGWRFPPNCNAISGKGFALDEIYIERY